MSTFSQVRAGDVVTRMLAGTIPMRLRVDEVTDTLIRCIGGWDFDRETGAEVDALFNSGSYLIPEEGR